MDFINNENLKAYWHLVVLGSIILGLILFFIFKFLIPSYRLKGNLDQTIQAIKKLKTSTEKGQAINIDLIRNEIMTAQKLGHCWSEFAETLHPQTATDDMGQERVVRWRSTVPAEVFFNVETLIAVELRTEYFKHQPGILTGIGIIGTFAGLLRGLSTFSVSSDPETVRLSLDTLIHGVVEAFTVSASAITLAMITTFLEKIIITRRIKQLEDLCQLLDSLFEGGAGEEYLARLVKSGESSATQTAQLKDALVSDLKEMLAEMTRQQTEAIAASFSENSRAQIVTTEQSGDRIAQAISDSLSEPLQRIASAVNTTTDTNGQVVTRALNEALITFSQKMEDMFGGQMGNINQLLQQTTTAMQSTVARFDQLSDNLSDAGKNAADVMSERLSTALESMEARQLTLNNTMTEFVSQLRDTVQSSQSETNSQLQKTLVLMGDQVAAMTDQLQKQAHAAADTHQNQQNTLQQNASVLAQELASQVQTSMTSMQQQLASMIAVMKEQSAQASLSNTEQQKTLTQHTQNTVGVLSDRVESTLANLDKNLTGMLELISKQAADTAQSHQTNQQQLAEQANRLVEQLSQQVQSMTTQTNNAVASMQASVTSMRDVTKDNTQRMENSAGTLSLAADNFSKAGNSVAGVIQQTSTVTDKMATTSVALNVAATTVQTALADYSSAGKAMSQMVEELKATVEVAKKDATVSQSLVNQIKQSAEHLMQAQSSVDGIFKEVCDELANAHEVFANNVVKGLKSSNTAYQKELKDAVDYLKTAIEELGEVAEKIPVRR
ncbi:MAG: anti-phage ZorAB system protein ZorA [Methylococcaceae bacterium]